MVFSSPRHLVVAGGCIIVMEIAYKMDFSLPGFVICSLILGFGMYNLFSCIFPFFLLLSIYHHLCLGFCMGLRLHVQLRSSDISSDPKTLLMPLLMHMFPLVSVVGQDNVSIHSYAINVTAD